MKYDARYWGNTSGVHASFPTFTWPFLSESDGWMRCCRKLTRDRNGDGCVRRHPWC